MALPSQPLDRRRVLMLAMAGTGAALLGTTVASCDLPATVSAAPTSGGTAATQALRALESQLPGRVGVHALDPASGATIGYRSDERFLLCSTGKVLTVAAIQRLSVTQPDLLGRLVRYSSSDVLQWAPVTSQHVDDGMTVAELCDAAITVSDNTAANLLVGLLGGPSAVTAFARTLGDTTTRADRIEPDLNVTSPGDLRDTSTPAQMARNLQTLVVGDALAPEARDRLTALLKANTTGAETIRAGVPSGWDVADKTGSGARGESNDIAVVWPPDRPSLVVAVYTSPSDPTITAQSSHAVIARATSIVTAALTTPAPR